MTDLTTRASRTSGRTFASASSVISSRAASVQDRYSSAGEMVAEIRLPPGYGYAFVDWSW
jgi:hypothetical protein